MPIDSDQIHEFSHHFPSNSHWLVVTGTFGLFSQKYWEGHHPNWRTHIFQWGGSTTNQICSWSFSESNCSTNYSDPEEFESSSLRCAIPLFFLIGHLSRWIWVERESWSCGWMIFVIHVIYLYDIWYMIHDIWYMINDKWYMIYHTWYIIHDMYT